MPPARRKTPEQRPHRFLQMLHHLGWSLGALQDPQPLLFGRSAAPRGTLQTAPLPDGMFLLLFFVDEALPRVEESFKAFEDYSPLHAELRAALRQQNLLSRHLLLVGREMEAQLIDLAREDILIDARGEEDISERLLPILHLNKLAAGSLAGFPRKSLGQRARELADWTRLWVNRLGAAAGSTPEIAERFLYWLFLARQVESLGLMPLGKLPLSDYGLPARPPQPARYLADLLRPLCESWNLLQGHSLALQNEIARQAQDGGQLRPCLESFSRLSCSKFSSQVFAEAFADQDLRLVSWRRSLVEEEGPPGDPMRWFADPAVVDLDETGFGGVLARFDLITEDLRRLAREQAVARERGKRPGLQLDFFGVEPPPLQEEDAPRTTLQMLLKVKTSRRDRAEVTRMVLLAHTAEWHARLRRPEPIFPAPQIIVPAGGEAPRRTGTAPRVIMPGNPGMN